MENYKGLTPEEVEASRAEHGSNILTPPKRRPVWLQFLDKFKDPIIRILLIALLFSFGVSAYHYFAEGAGANVFFEPAGILVAILLATLVGFILELRANKAFDVLNKVNDDTPVKVYRSGELVEVPKKDVVVGDIVLLETGEEVPADGELLEAVSLSVNESTLTGEPLARKGVEADTPQGLEATYPYHHVMKGTTVSEGRGVMRVFAVGDASEYGKVYVASQIDSSTRTPLNQQLDRLSKVISIASYIIAGLIVVGRLAVYFLDGQHSGDAFSWSGFGSYLLNTFMIAVTLIVVSVPEGLPMSVTLSLALSMKRMLASNNLVRKIHACETMGAATVICTDKTGTLTQNRMTVAEARFLVDDKVLVEQSIAANSTAHIKEEDGNDKVMGNPTEGALLLWLKSRGDDPMALRASFEVYDQLTFSTERKYMATVVRHEGKLRLLIKGAPEIVLGLCTEIAGGASREEILEILRGCQAKAMRTLGFAYKDMAADAYPEGALDPKSPDTVIGGLTFIGLTAISDPVRPTVPAAIRSCIDAGIDVKMVTGDTSVTAAEIGRQVGLVPEDVTLEQIQSGFDGNGRRFQITGPEFAALSDEELEACVSDLKVISRARPLDKERLVKTLQKKGEVVAVTGDGTNDAPALNAAQVGLSMGDGTSVAKEASDITILDNSFDSIVNAVVWGRSLYKNIQRFILFQLTINVVASLIVLIGAFIGEQSPLTVTQMLWVNLIMDTFAAIALASLPPTRDVLKEKPRRRSDFIISRNMAALIFGVGAAFVAVLMWLLLYFRNDGDGLTTYELSMFFTAFVMLQLWNMFNVKAFMTGKSAFSHLFSSKGFIWMVVVILAGQILITTFGGEMFSVVPIRPLDWLKIVGLTSAVLWVGEIARLFSSIGTSRSRGCR
ncbi:calcium-translocating P-type ATPase, PMCA-type [Muribaculum sp. An289]|uniref:calcium-translocating P-type ATPase, PMCA-type n=1 Tax=unclassified Muribaculum TaxID=2622126 RepID=UPI000B37A24B|nr:MULTISPECIES: calcium-translocating P-type ATPase, PMCA-type [unclassified Muribaculum]OUO37036.1 calcium-translocating P-type ATPase, PMCA-type [Muribaculum sp. An289]OUO42535.1 calcium-translocating P-type ATPase, PMCA-type [Muribaculum sp. An287]